MKNTAYVKCVWLARHFSMDIDGWSNIHNEPVLCASLTTEDGDSYLVKTIDTFGHPHDTNYLTEVAKQYISDVTIDFSVNIRSIVTDGAANMAAMRRELLKDDCNCNIAYDCSAHIANSLSKDLDIADVRGHIVQIVRHIRYNHDASSQYKKAGGN